MHLTQKLTIIELTVKRKTIHRVFSISWMVSQLCPLVECTRSYSWNVFFSSVSPKRAEWIYEQMDENISKTSSMVQRNNSKIGSRNRNYVWSVYF
jgi:hypothetical protein